MIAQFADGTSAVDFTKLREHLTACRLDRFEGTFTELEPDFDVFVRRFTCYAAPDAETAR